MVLPFITSVCRDVFDTVRRSQEAAYGIGCTPWEVMRNVISVHAGRLIGGVMLGLGRALGETMAVTFVIGNAHKITAWLLAPGTTISATIANEFTEATGTLHVVADRAGADPVRHHLYGAGAARNMLMRIERQIGSRP